MPKFRRSSFSLGNIQMVKPVVDDTIETRDERYHDNTRVNSSPMDRNNPQQHNSFPSSFLSFNRKIIVDEEENVLRNAEYKQVMQL
jgi:hypothetical protein